MHSHASAPMSKALLTKLLDGDAQLLFLDRLMDIVFLQALPMTSTGRIRKFELRQAHQSHYRQD